MEDGEPVAHQSAEVGAVAIGARGGADERVGGSEPLGGSTGGEALGEAERERRAERPGHASQRGQEVAGAADVAVGGPGEHRLHVRGHQLPVAGKGQRPGRRAQWVLVAVDVLIGVFG